MSETLRTPDQNLQLLIERYALPGDDYQPLSIDVSNATATDITNAGPRQGKIYGELTEYGLVHAWADPDKTQYSNAEILIVNRDSVITYAHCYDRLTERYDWLSHTGTAYSIPLVRGSDPIQLRTLPELTGDYHYGTDRERIQKSYSRVTRALAGFADMASRYDALHQATVTKSPAVHENCAQLFPYAGQPIGPRVTIEDMIKAGMPIHPGVAAALEIVPEMKPE